MGLSLSHLQALKENESHMIIGGRVLSFADSSSSYSWLDDAKKQPLPYLLGSLMVGLLIASVGGVCFNRHLKAELNANKESCKTFEEENKRLIERHKSALALEAELNNVRLNNNYLEDKNKSQLTHINKLKDEHKKEVRLLTEDIANHKTEIGFLKKNEWGLRVQQSKHIKQAIELSTEKARLDFKFYALTSEIHNLKDEIIALRNETISLRALNKDRNEDIRKSVFEKNALQIVSAKLKEENQFLKVELVKERQEIGVLKNEIDALNKALNGLRQKKIQLEKLCDKLKERKKGQTNTFDKSIQTPESFSQETEHPPTSNP